MSVSFSHPSPGARLRRSTPKHKGGTKERTSIVARAGRPGGTRGTRGTLVPAEESPFTDPSADPWTQGTGPTKTSGTGSLCERVPGVSLYMSSGSTPKVPPSPRSGTPLVHLGPPAGGRPFTGPGHVTGASASSTAVRPQGYHEYPRRRSQVWTGFGTPGTGRGTLPVRKEGGDGGREGRFGVWRRKPGSSTPRPDVRSGTTRSTCSKGSRPSRSTGSSSSRCRRTSCPRPSRSTRETHCPRPGHLPGFGGGPRIPSALRVRGLSLPSSTVGREEFESLKTISNHFMKTLVKTQISFHSSSKTFTYLCTAHSPRTTQYSVTCKCFYLQWSVWAIILFRGLPCSAVPPSPGGPGALQVSCRGRPPVRQGTETWGAIFVVPPYFT